MSLVFSLAGFLYFALGVVSGPLADRWGSQRLATLGMLIMGAGLVLAGLAADLISVYLAYGLGVGLGVGLAYVPAIGAVQRWFVPRRGLASGLAVSGIGVGTLVMPPMASALIATLGWRHAYMALGLFVAVVGAGLALLIANDPNDHGLAPDGEAADVKVHRPRAGGVSITRAVTSWRFAGLYLACLVGSFGLFVPFAHLAPYAQDHGIPVSSAVFLLGVIGVGSTLGRSLIGGLADRIGRLPSLIAMFAGIAFSMVMWAFSTEIWSLGAFAFVFVSFYGGFVAVLPAVVMDDFGGKNVSGIIGILYASVAFGTLIGPSAAGYAFDVVHNYTLPIWASFCANIVAGCIIARTARAPIPLHAALEVVGD